MSSLYSSEHLCRPMIESDMSLSFIMLDGRWPSHYRFPNNYEHNQDCELNTSDDIFRSQCQ